MGLGAAILGSVSGPSSPRRRSGSAVAAPRWWAGDGHGLAPAQTGSRADDRPVPMSPARSEVDRHPLWSHALTVSWTGCPGGPTDSRTAGTWTRRRPPDGGHFTRVASSLDAASRRRGRRAAVGRPPCPGRRTARAGWSVCLPGSWRSAGPVAEGRVDPQLAAVGAGKQLSFVTVRQPAATASCPGDAESGPTDLRAGPPAHPDDQAVLPVGERPESPGPPTVAALGTATAAGPRCAGVRRSRTRPLRPPSLGTRSPAV